MKYVVFDGDCGICSYSAGFIERNKRDKRIKTIPNFQFDLNKYGINPETANMTVIYIDDRRNKKYFRTRAIMEICKNLKFPFRILGYLFANPVASFLFDPIYNLIATNRAYISTKLGLNACKIR
jgi:predicted DCC family thiol-disulfide oxidoreductase YuxK